MVIFGHRRGGVQPSKNPEITLFTVKFSNSRGGGPDPRSPPLDPRMWMAHYYAAIISKDRFAVQEVLLM